jgi:sialidase-1
VETESEIHVDVFTSGTEGYHTFRIPAIETAADGTLVALAEARKYSRSDPGHNDNEIDLVYKRSEDGGETWSDLLVLVHPGERWSACNPEILLDRTTGRLFELHCRTKPGCTGTTSRVGTDDC